MSDLDSRLLKNQCTVKTPFSVEGIGVHGGKPARVTVSPLPSHSGLWFEVKHRGRVKRFPALAHQIQPFFLATCVGEDAEASIKTVEHLLSGLYGLGVDNALISVVGDEMPIGDGSAWPFVAPLLEVGIHIFDEKKKWVKLKEEKTFHEEGRFIRYTPDRENGLQIIFSISYAHPLISDQTFVFDFNPNAYVREICKARTFGFLKDAQKLFTHGLALGASETNTIILTEKNLVNAEPLRYADEFVRHKICDALGDLALSGVYPHGTIVYEKSGHLLNGELSRWVLNQSQDQQTEVQSPYRERHASV